ncbi:hypothetical protein EON79_16495 [bacterium]|nr:MAG: hypothetical protein EON79_16495 [bacterium]
MSKFLLISATIPLLMCLSGCGGSDSSSESGAIGGGSETIFVGTLPDGAPMILEVFAHSGKSWTGDFAVASETGPYAFQTGAFEGSIEGMVVNATCETGDGTEFQLTGSANQDGSLDLMRSDIPGKTLRFVPQTVTPRRTRADRSFTINTGHTRGRATVSDQPRHEMNGVRAYDGFWNGTPIRIWSYDSGRASLNIYLDYRFISTTILSSYRLSDFPTATVTGTSEILYDCTNPATRFTFPSTLKVSPP